MITDTRSRNVIGAEGRRAAAGRRPTARTFHRGRHHGTDRHRPVRPGQLRRRGPLRVVRPPPARGPRPLAPGPRRFAEGFWSVTRFDDCVGVNRDYEHFSSDRSAALFHDMDEEGLAQQRMMMLNMDPPLHTRYRRLVNKGFTPRMIRDLEAKVVASADSIIDTVCEAGSADFVEQISAELPLQVIADLMGVPQEDRHLVFDWSNQMIGSDDPEYQVSADAPAQAAMELFAYADELCAKKRLDPHEDLFSVLTQAEIDGRPAVPARARPLLPAAVGGRQRDHPQPHLRGDGGLLRPPRPVGAAPGRPLAPARRPSRRCCASSPRSCTSAGRPPPT